MKKDLTKIRKEEEELYKNFLIVRNEYIYTNNKKEEQRKITEIKKIFKKLDPLQIKLQIMNPKTSKERLEAIIDMCKESKDKYIKSIERSDDDNGI